MTQQKQGNPGGQQGKGQPAKTAEPTPFDIIGVVGVDFMWNRHCENEVAAGRQRPDFTTANMMAVPEILSLYAASRRPKPLTPPVSPATTAPSTGTQSNAQPQTGLNHPAVVRALAAPDQPTWGGRLVRWLVVLSLAIAAGLGVFYAAQNGLQVGNMIDIPNLRGNLDRANRALAEERNARTRELAQITAANTARVSTLDSQLSQLRQQLAQATVDNTNAGRLETARADLARITSERDEAVRTLASVRSELQTRTNERNAARTDLASTTASLTTMTAERDTARQEIEDQRLAHVAAIGTWSRALTSAQARVDQLTIELEMISAQRAAGRVGEEIEIDLITFYLEPANGTEMRIRRVGEADWRTITYRAGGNGMQIVTSFTTRAGMHEVQLGRRNANNEFEARGRAFQVSLMPGPKTMWARVESQTQWTELARSRHFILLNARDVVTSRVPPAQLAARRK